MVRDNVHEEARIAGRHRLIESRGILVPQKVKLRATETRVKSLEGLLCPLREARFFSSNTGELRAPSGLSGLNVSGKLQRRSCLIIGEVRIIGS